MRDRSFPRFLPIAAYLILALAIAYAVYETDRLHDADLRQQKTQNAQAAKATKQAIFIGCMQRNEVRVILQDILKGFQKRAESQGEGDLAPYDVAIARLEPDDCKSLANTVPSR